MDHPTTVWNLGPALDQHWVGFAIAIWKSNRINRIGATDRVETRYAIIMPVTADIVTRLGHR